jgi:uncharacterized short protein YbdD (DUF466 family)
MQAHRVPALLQFRSNYCRDKVLVLDTVHHISVIESVSIIINVRSMRGIAKYANTVPRMSPQSDVLSEYVDECANEKHDGYDSQRCC